MKHLKSMTQVPAKAQLLPDGHPAIDISTDGFLADPLTVIAAHLPLLKKDTTPAA